MLGEVAGFVAVEAVFHHQGTETPAFGSIQVNAEHAGNAGKQQFCSWYGEDHAAFEAEGGHQGADQGGPGAIGDGDFGAELAGDPLAHGGFANRLEVQGLGQQPRHLFHAAPRLAGQNDKGHLMGHRSDRTRPCQGEARFRCFVQEPITGARQA